MTTMSEHHAYVAMFEYLKAIYDRTQSDELGGLLGGMCLLEDGTTADPAAWADWEEAVKRASEKVKLNFRE